MGEGCCVAFCFLVYTGAAKPASLPLWRKWKLKQPKAGFSERSKKPTTKKRSLDIARETIARDAATKIMEDLATQNTPHSTLTHTQASETLPCTPKVPEIPLHTTEFLAHVNFRRVLTSGRDEFLGSHPHHDAISHPTQPPSQFRTLMSAPTRKQNHTRKLRLRV